MNKNSNIRIRLLFIILFIAINTHSYAVDYFKVNKIQYNLISEEAVSVSSYNNISGNISIPEKINYNGKSFLVTSIDENAFYECERLKEITLPSSLTSIKKGAFKKCRLLTKVIFSSSSVLTSIGENAFEMCLSLKEIILPFSLSSIGNWAFGYCSSLEELTLPTSLTSIGDWAFANCSSLKVLTLPTTLTSIGAFAFQDCNSLTSVIGLNSNISIGGFPFGVHGFYDKFEKLKETYEYFANGYILKEILLWQKRKGFETIKQWKERVTDDNQKKLITELSLKAKQAFIANRVPAQLIGHLGLYDTVDSSFLVNFDNLATIYVKVPISEVQNFKDKWDEVKVVDPSYGIVNNNVALLSCKFMFKNKEYVSEQNYIPNNALTMSVELPKLDIELVDNDASVSKFNTTKQIAKSQQIDNDVDKNIPIRSATNVKRFAVIIGNENYQNVEHVEFANNDASVFSEYCQNTLGIPKNNIKLYKDATYGTLFSAIGKLKSIAKAYKGNINVIFYYAGHGVPSEEEKNAFLLPVDADGQQMDVCISTKRLYKELNSLNARSVVVFIDACFSGSQRGYGMLAAARGVAIKAKDEIPEGNLIVFSAATGSQTAYPYKEKGHGLFTYYILKKLQNSKGSVTLGELSDYLKENVLKSSVVINEKEQTPTIVASPELQNTWRTLKLTE